MTVIEDKKKSLPAIAALLGAAAGLMVFLEKFTFGSHSPVRESLLDFGHAPLFGLMAIIILWLVRLSFGGRIGAPIQYAIAWMAAVGIGGLSEYMQIATHRDADPIDWLFDIIGATTFLAFYFTIDRRLSPRGKSLQIRHKTQVRVAVAAVLATAAIPLFISCAAQLQRRVSFPKLYTFDNFFERKFLVTSYVDVKTVAPPDKWDGRISRVAEVTFLPSRYPTLYLNGPFPDWSGYRALTLEVFSPAEAPLALSISIWDRDSAQYHDRYNGRLRIEPGYNKLEILLTDVERAPATRTLDLSAIRVILLFVVEPEQPAVLYLDNLVLE